MKLLRLSAILSVLVEKARRGEAALLGKNEEEDEQGNLPSNPFNNDGGGMFSPGQKNEDQHGSDLDLNGIFKTVMEDNPTVGGVDAMVPKPSEINRYLEVYNNAVEQGIVPPPCTGDCEDKEKELDPIAVFQSTIEAALALDDDRMVIIENRFRNNRFRETSTHGLALSPEIKHERYMVGAFNNNNNAESQEGNVRRQNGVVDFTGSFANNENDVMPEFPDFPPFGGGGRGVDEEGNGRKRNLRGKKSKSSESTNKSSESKTSTGGSFLPESKSRKGGSSEEESPDTIEKLLKGKKGAVYILNSFEDNDYWNNKHNGVLYNPKLTGTTDMSTAFSGNNNALSEKGDVSRQIGVTDFTDAAKDNKNAVSLMLADYT